MTESTSLKTRAGPLGLVRGLGASALALALFASQAAPAYAAIDQHRYCQRYTRCRYIGSTIRLGVRACCDWCANTNRIKVRCGTC